MNIENIPTSSSPFPNTDTTYANQRIIIIILLIILIFSLLGSEAFVIINNVINYLITNIGNGIMYISSNLGYSVGTMVDTTSNVASNATISSVQIADGALNSVGDIFRDANASRVSPEFKKDMDTVANNSKDFLLLPAAKGVNEKTTTEKAKDDYSGLRRDLDDVINKINNIGISSSATTAKVDSTESSIQRPISAQKTSWCLVGEYNQKRGCVSVNQGDKCMSGMLFDTSDQCIGGVK